MSNSQRPDDPVTHNRRRRDPEYTTLSFFTLFNAALPSLSLEASPQVEKSQSGGKEDSVALVRNHLVHLYYSKALCIFTSVTQSEKLHHELLKKHTPSMPVYSTVLPYCTDLYTCPVNNSGETDSSNLSLQQQQQQKPFPRRLFSIPTSSQRARSILSSHSIPAASFSFIAHMEYISTSDTIVLFICEASQEDESAQSHGQDPNLSSHTFTISMHLTFIHQKSGKKLHETNSFITNTTGIQLEQLKVQCHVLQEDELVFVVEPLPSSVFVAKIDSTFNTTTAQNIISIRRSSSSLNAYHFNDVTISEHNLASKNVGQIVGVAREEPASRIVGSNALYVLSQGGQIVKLSLEQKNTESVQHVAHFGAQKVPSASNTGAATVSGVTASHSNIPNNITLLANTFDVSDVEDNELCYMSDKNARYSTDQNQSSFMIAASPKNMHLFRVDSITTSDDDDGSNTHTQQEQVYRETFPSIIQTQKKELLQWFSKYLVLVTRDNSGLQNVWLLDLVNELIACDMKLKPNETVHSVHQIDTYKCAVAIVRSNHANDNSATSNIGHYLRILEEKPIKTQVKLLREKSKYLIAKRLLIDTSTDKELYKDDIIGILQTGGEIEATKPNGAESSVNYFLGVDMPGLQGTDIEVDPSDAIRYYMQTENLEALMLYLRKLHIYKPHRAESDHTELLLNLYFHFIFDSSETENGNGSTEGNSDKLTRSQLAKEKLDSFLDTEFPPTQAGSIQLAAIRALRGVGLRKEAMKQAYIPSRRRYDTIVEMEIQDYPNCAPYDKSHFLRAIVALEQMMKNNIERTRQLLEMHGERLLSEVPREATNLMIRVWCDGRQFVPNGPNRVLFESHSGKSVREEYTKKGDDENPSFPIFSKFSENIPQENLDASHEQNGDSELEDGENGDDNDEKERIICPQHFIKNFKDPFWRMVYLECLVSYRHSELGECLDTVIYNTLIECYLELARQTPDGLDTRMYSPEKKNITRFPYTFPGEPRQKMRSRMPRKGAPSNSSRENENLLIPEQKQINTMLMHMDTPNQLAYDIFPPNKKLIYASYKEKIDMILSMVTVPLRNKDQKDSTLHSAEEVEPVYDLEHVLLLMHMYKYEEGILLMYEKLQLSYEILEHYKRKADYELRYLNVVKQCEKHGKRDPNMWIQVLSYLTAEIDQANEDELEQCARKYLQRVLHDLGQSQLVPSLLVIQILSRTSKIQLNTIRDYLKNHLHDQHQIIDQSSNRIAALENEVQVLSKEVTSLTTQAQVFQRQRCAACDKPLQIPSVIFMCGHCYHQRCLGRYLQCSLCQPKLLKNVEEFKSSISKTQELYRAHRSLKKKTAHHFDLWRENLDA